MTLLHPSCTSSLPRTKTLPESKLQPPQRYLSVFIIEVDERSGIEYNANGCESDNNY